MNLKYHILLNENCPHDTYLTRVLFRGMDTRVSILSVDNKEDYQKELLYNKFDLIISDVAMVDFDEFEALQLAKHLAPTTPFIYLSGSLNEEKLCKCIGLGAMSYVLKSEPAKLEKLVKDLFKLHH